MTNPTASGTTPALPAWKVLLFTTVLFGIFAVILEVSAHFYLKATRGYDGEHLLQYAFDPYKNIVPTPNFVDTRGIRHNAVGFRRSSEVSREKAPGTYRVFLMGASTAYGLGGLWTHIQDDYAVIPNDQTIDAYLEKSLQARFPDRKIEVINAAITSTWTHHNLIYLNQQVLSYDPDMILFLDGFNDFYWFDPSHNQFASYAYGEQSARIMGEPTFGALVFQNFWWLYRKSAFVHVMTREARKLGGLFSRPTRSPIDVDKDLANLQSVFARGPMTMIGRYVRMTSDAGVIPVEIHQPLLIMERGRKSLSGVEQQLFEYNVSSYRPNYEAMMQRAVPWVNDTLAKVVARAGGHYIDATRIYGESQGQIFTDYCHLTPKGNELLAAYIEQRIVPLIAADRGGAPAMPSSSGAAPSTARRQ
jgi:lysophospholipase L1-like esterase